MDLNRQSCQVTPVRPGTCQGHDIMTILQQLTRYRGTDETGGAGDEDFHSVFRKSRRGG